MTIRWGFIGAGWIAQRAMAPAVHAAAGATLHSAASGDRAAAAGLAPENVARDYRAVVNDEDVDVVYVCLANGRHEEWVLRALDAGKHVLCEKPMGVDAGQVQRMADASRAAGLLLVEAVWCRWHPRTRRLAHLCRSGDLGEVLSIDSAFTFPADLEGNYRADPAQGGGALLDVGGYQAHAWLELAGQGEAVDVLEVERRLGPTGIDLTTKVLARLGTGGRATAVASLAMPEHQYLTVTGTDQVARMGRGAAFTSWREPSSLLVGDHEEEFPAVDAYQLMVEAVGARIRGEESWIVPLADSVEVARIVSAVADHPSLGSMA